MIEAVDVDDRTEAFPAVAIDQFGQYLFEGEAVQGVVWLRCHEAGFLVLD